MIVLFDTVRRERPVKESGELVLLDWPDQKVIRSRSVYPTSPDIVLDPNPRGNSRGGKGILVLGEEIWVATYHSILILDWNLNEIRRISNPLFAGLHELSLGEGGIWVASTAIDAAILIDASGRVLQVCLPRNETLLQEGMGLEPWRIDLHEDHRIQHLPKEVSKTPGHIHLNGIACRGADAYALLNACGAVVQIAPKMRILARDPMLRGAHSPKVTMDGRELALCASFHKRILFVDIDTGRISRAFDLLEIPELRLLKERKPDRPYSASFFLRGLAQIDKSRWLVGIAPASVVEIDIDQNRLLKHYAHSLDVSDAVHGLVWIPREKSR